MAACSASRLRMSAGAPPPSITPYIHAYIVILQRAAVCEAHARNNNNTLHVERVSQVIHLLFKVADPDIMSTALRALAGP
jgi:hypothetical protein